MALIIANNRLKMEFPLGLRALYFEMAQGTLRFKDNSHAYNAIVGRIEGAMMAQCAALGVARSDIIRILHKYVSATNKLHTISTGAVWKEFGLDSWQSLADLVTYELKSEINYLQEIDLAVYSADGALLAAVGPPLPAPPSQHMVPGWMRARGAGPTVALALPDGRFVVARWQRPHRPLRLLGALGLLAIAMALGTYSIVRRITRRLERLQTQVEALGAGDLTVRVEVEGRDEVAQLARSFNHAADRIARLVNAQRTMLAGASHELRSPLARMRMAIELLPHDERPELQVRLTQDIVELDALIDELLLASRLDTLEHLEHTEETDLLALLAEEGARSGAEVSGSPICIQGEPRMLRRLMRNLFENAQRYAAGSPIEASVVPLHPTGAHLCIADRGPGVPEQERERIFAPFYRPAGMRERGDGGVGLGLALVRQIARHHGGDVRCVPRHGGGTCFEVTLHSVPGVGKAT